MKSAIRKAAAFLRHGLWTFDASGRGPAVVAGVRMLRAAAVVVNGFRRDQCALHASALTYYTLMALIPVLALSLSLVRVLGGDDLARRQLEDRVNVWMAEMQQTVEQTTDPATADARTAQQEAVAAFTQQVQGIVAKGFEQVSGINFGKLGGIGAIGLLTMAIGLLRKVESSFNQIWGVTVGRSVWRTFSDYLVMLIVLPFLLVAASTVPVVDLFHTSVSLVNGTMADTFRSVVGSVWIKKLLVLGFASAALAFLLGFMPNTRVKLPAALLAGLVTALVFAGWMRVCVMFQVGIVKYSALYGSFAAMPILLMWVYVSWQIVLAGAELSFAVQDGESWGLDLAAAAASPRARALMAVALCAEAARLARLPQGEALVVEKFAAERKVSLRLVQGVVAGLARKGILAQIAGQPGAYLLCRCGCCVRADEVVRTVLDDGAALAELGLGAANCEQVASWDEGFDAVLRQAFGKNLADAGPLPMPQGA